MPPRRTASFYFDLNAPVAIGANTTIWLNTDLNAATGYQIFGFAGGAEYNVNSSRATGPLARSIPALTARPSSSTTSRSPIRPITLSVELAIPLASIGNPNNPIDVLYDVNNSTLRSRQLFQPALRRAQRRS